MILSSKKNNNGVFGVGLGGHKHYFHISGGGVEYVFPTGLGGSSKFMPTT